MVAATAVTLQRQKSLATLPTTFDYESKLIKRISSFNLKNKLLLHGLPELTVPVDPPFRSDFPLTSFFSVNLLLFCTRLESRPALFSAANWHPFCSSDKWDPRLGCFLSKPEMKQAVHGIFPSFPYCLLVSVKSRIASDILPDIDPVLQAGLVSEVNLLDLLLLELIHTYIRGR